MAVTRRAAEGLECPGSPTRSPSHSDEPGAGLSDRQADEPRYASRVREPRYRAARVAELQSQILDDSTLGSRLRDVSEQVAVRGLRQLLFRDEPHRIDEQVEALRDRAGRRPPDDEDAVVGSEVLRAPPLVR